MIDNSWERYNKSLSEFKFNESLKEVWELISFCDKYIEKEKPWQKSENSSLVINDLLIILTNITYMLQPFLPKTSRKILGQLGIKAYDKISQFKIKKEKVLFPRF